MCVCVCLSVHVCVHVCLHVHVCMHVCIIHMVDSWNFCDSHFGPITRMHGSSLMIVMNYPDETTKDYTYYICKPPTDD